MAVLVSLKVCELILCLIFTRARALIMVVPPKV